MITLEQLIINELKDVLNHEPSKAELDSASEFLAQQNINYLVDLEWFIHQWSKRKTHECAWCGKRFLESEMMSTAGNEWFCCDQCKHDYKQEHGVAECVMD